MLTPSEMAETCDVTVDTLRYYEREGLLESVERTSGGQRRYSEDDVAWVQILRCLRTTALPIREMQRFAELVRAGDAAMPERVALLTNHRAEVVLQMQALQDALTMIDHKIDAYSTHLASNPAVDTHGIETTPTLGGQGARSTQAST